MQPHLTDWISALSISTTDVPDAFSGTGLGRAVGGLGAHVALVARGVVALGTLSTLTARLVRLEEGGARVPMISHKVGSTDADAIEWPVTADGEVILQTTEHIGADAVAVEVHGDAQGGAGTSVVFYLRGASL